MNQITDEMILEKAKEYRAKWLERENFNEEGYTFIYFPKDSYEVKETLKANGYTFSRILMWHNKVEQPNTVKLHYSEILEFSRVAMVSYNPDCVEIVKRKIKEARPADTSVWFEDEKVTEVPVTLAGKAGFDNQFGHQFIYTFKDTDNHVFIWFTKKYFDYDINTSLILSATVKAKQEYDGTKQTVITRAKLSEA